MQMYSIQYGVCNILYCKNFHSSNQVQILSLLNLHFIVSFHEKSGGIIYLLKLFVIQVLNVCHSLLDTLKKHAVWSTKPTHTWPRVEIKGGDEFSKNFLTPGGGSKGRDDF